MQGIMEREHLKGMDGKKMTTSTSPWEEEMADS